MPRSDGERPFQGRMNGILARDWRRLRPGLVEWPLQGRGGRMLLNRTSRIGRVTAPLGLESRNTRDGTVLPTGQEALIEREDDLISVFLAREPAVVEFARDVAGLNAYSSEMLEESSDEQKKDKDFVIDFIDEQKAIHTKGGTMRLGGYDCWLEKDSLAFELFGTEKIRERHRHRLEVQGKFLPLLESKGLVVSGKHKYKGKDGEPAFLVELIELSRKDHPYFIATQSHPEFLSRPDKPQPLFFGLVEAASKL